MAETKEKNTTTEIRREHAVLVSVIRDGMQPQQAEEYLDELEFLAETASIVTVRRFLQRLPQPSARIYVGPGKLEEIAEYCKENEIDVVIFDDELSPSQTRNIEQAMPCRIMDRTRLILDIFMSRAQTAYAKTQVELAQCQYMLPRLAGLWTHLERQRGGTGTRGGAGEREIETDRRIVRNRIAKLKEDLRKIDRQMAVQRSNRGSMVRVSLVGYTNVGKSTLMNLISKSDVFAENKLFATLDTTVRKVVFDNLPFLLSDTVGFIRKLPTELIESFKSTLDEVREADLLIHVRSTHTATSARMRTTSHRPPGRTSRSRSCSGAGSRGRTPRAYSSRHANAPTSRSSAATSTAWCARYTAGDTRSTTFYIDS